MAQRSGLCPFPRTAEEIEAANVVKVEDLRDSQNGIARVQRSQWLIVKSTCIHAGCIPLRQRPTDPRGEFGGRICPCHGSQCDTSDRIRRGPAPRNLDVPPYACLTDTTIRIG